MKTFFTVSIIGLGLSGCALFTAPMNNPTYEKHASPRDGHVTTYSMIPSRRMVIVANDSTKSKQDGDRPVICAEASADVTDNLISTLGASLSASGPVSKSTGEVSAGVSQALATTAQFLYKRTQGVQLYRDGMYHLCQARMNRYLNDDEYKEKSKILLEASVTLIEHEIPHLQPIVNAPPVPVTLTVPNVGAKTGTTSVIISGTEVKSVSTTPQNSPAATPRTAEEQGK
jgi:hypothetical protein